MSSSLILVILEAYISNIYFADSKNGQQTHGFLIVDAPPYT